jgi:hypothetical protein
MLTWCVPFQSAGSDTKVQISATLASPIEAGATVEAWLSELSIGEVARLAVNQFVPNTDICRELYKMDRKLKRELSLPKNCPVAAGTTFAFDQILGRDFWNSIGEYRATVVGASGMMEVRLWSAAPCTLCFNEPILLAGISVPFEIADKPDRPRTRRKQEL